MIPDDASGIAGTTRKQDVWVLALLTLVSTISFLDRYMLAVLVEPVKAELSLSDTEIGLLTGFAFSAVYAIFGLPMARLADRGRHRHVIVGSLLAWSGMTALCGAAGSFLALALARFGVGAGEAGAMPASQALLSQRFSPRRLNLALAILGCGGPIGLLVAFLTGGLLEARFGWRMTFVVFSVPGLVLALIFWFTTKDLQRRDHTAARQRRLNAVGILLRDPVFRNIALAQAGLALLIFGQTQWLPAFFERSFDLPRTQVGPMLTLTSGGAAIVGMIAGGIAADRLAARDARWPLRIAIGALLLAAALYTAASPDIGFALAAVMGLCLSVPAGPVLAFIQTIVPQELRATAAACSALAAAFLGLGAGPLAIGMASDALAPQFGTQSLRYALLLTVALVLPLCLFQFVKVRQLQSRAHLLQ